MRNAIGFWLPTMSRYGPPLFAEAPGYNPALSGAKRACDRSSSPIRIQHGRNWDAGSQAADGAGWTDRRQIAFDFNLGACYSGTAIRYYHRRE